MRLAWYRMTRMSHYGQEKSVSGERVPIYTKVARQIVRVVILHGRRSRKP
jgi:hypothetical protein